MDRISVRKAGEKDVEALAHILVTSFKTAFADIIREETIDRCANEENCRNMFAAIWAFKENHRARRFYEKNGFVWDGSERVSEFDGAMEIRYTFEFV